VRLDVERRGDGLVLSEQATGDRLVFVDAAVHEYELMPTEPLDGDHFVVRFAPEHPWVPLTFTPSHLFTSGRVTPRR
jgi:hypothetical protein